MIDIGVNLTNSQLLSSAEAVLKRAYEAGIQHCVITGTDIDSSQQAIQLAVEFDEAFPGMLSCTVGIHPHDAKDSSSASIEQLRELSQHFKVVAIGETGLDFNRNYSPQDKQIESFEAQIELAAETGKPLFLHERDAFEKEIEILRYYRDSISDAVVHCFTGDKKALFSYLDMDLHIGITGWVCDERRGAELAKIIANIPLNRLMVETDAPFLLPKNISPKPTSRTNEPAFLPWVVQKVASCFNEGEDVIAAATSNTAKCFFRLMNQEK